MERAVNLCIGLYDSVGLCCVTQASVVARAGDSCDVGLTGIEASALHPGTVLCPPDWPSYVARKLELRMVVLDPPVPITPGAAVELHTHTAREEGHIVRLLSTLDSKTGEVTKVNPRRLIKGQTAAVLVTAARDMCLEEYSKCKALGRLALRQSGRTIAVGVVTRVLDEEHIG